MATVTFTAALRPCPDCHTPLRLSNGKFGGPITFWSDSAGAHMTPHADDCPLRGCVVSTIDWGVGEFGGGGA